MGGLYSMTQFGIDTTVCTDFKLIQLKDVIKNIDLGDRINDYIQKDNFEIVINDVKENGFKRISMRSITPSFISFQFYNNIFVIENHIGKVTFKDFDNFDPIIFCLENGRYTDQYIMNSLFLCENEFNIFVDFIKNYNCKQS